jgi:hypothetical protein
VVQLGAITLSASPISKLRAAEDERRQAKRNSLADRLAVEAKALADLKIEKAAVETRCCLGPGLDNCRSPYGPNLYPVEKLRYGR